MIFLLPLKQNKMLIDHYREGRNSVAIHTTRGSSRFAANDSQFDRGSGNYTQVVDIALPSPLIS
jgi:hypothetical protein